MSKSAVLLEVKPIKPNEESERLIKRFLKKFKKAKLMDEIKKKTHYEKPSDVRRAKKKRTDYIIEQKMLEEKEKEKKGQ